MAKINIQAPAPIVLEQPGKNLWQGVGATVLRGVISDLFHQARQQRNNELSNLWQGAKMNTETILGMSNPEEVQDSIIQFQQQYDNPKTPSSVKEKIAPLLNKLEVHQNKMIKQDPVNRATITAGGREAEVKSILNNQNLYKDVKVLEEAEQGIENDINNIVSLSLIHI